MLADAERAPDGSWVDASSCDLESEAIKDCASNISTDSCADYSSTTSSECEPASTIAQGQRLPIFQSIVSQMTEEENEKIKSLKLEETHSSSCASEA